MQIEPLGLFVFFVPAQVQPFQTFEDGIDRGLGVAFNVSVVKAENHGAAVVAGVEPVENEGASATYVKKSGRRWSEADARLG